MKNWRSFRPKDAELSRLVQSLKDFFQQFINHSLLKSDPGKGKSGQVLTSNGETGEQEWKTSPSGFADPMTTRGDIIYRDNTNTTTRLGAGASGHILTSNGTDISWQPASGGGAVTSVFGRTGAVVSATNDYTWAQIDKTISDIADITNKSHTDLTDIGTNTHAQIDTHISSTSNPHSVTASQVGLGNVDNTSDVNKPISTATQAALDDKADDVYASAQYYDGTGGTSVDSTSYTTIPMDDNDFEDSEYSNTLGVVTVTSAGRHKIESYICVAGAASNYRWTGEIQIWKNGTTELKTAKGGYIRSNGGSNDTQVAITHVADLAASDTIEIRVRKINSVAGNATTVANCNQLLITRLT